MDAIDSYIKAHAPKAAVVMGGGFVGLEMAEAFAKRGLQTTVVEMMPTVMAAMDTGFGRRVADELRANGVEASRLLSLCQAAGYPPKHRPVLPVLPPPPTLPIPLAAAH